MPIKQGKEGVKQEMHKFKHGELHSGSKHGPVVKNRKQAIAIALHQAGLSKNKKNETREYYKNEIKCILAESIISGKSYTQDFNDEDEPDSGEGQGKMDMSPRDAQKYLRRKAMMDKIIRHKISKGERSPEGAEHYNKNFMTQAMEKGKVPSEKFAKVRIDKDGSIIKTRSSGRRGIAGGARGTTPGPLGHSRYNTLHKPSNDPGELKPASSFVGKAPSEEKGKALERGAEAAGKLNARSARRRMLALKLAKIRGKTPGLVGKANINPEVKKSLFKAREGRKQLPKPQIP